jgi:hypothetical protein
MLVILNRRQLRTMLEQLRKDKCGCAFLEMERIDDKQLSVQSFQTTNHSEPIPI